MADTKKAAVSSFSITPMPSRNTYTTITPEYSEFLHKASIPSSEDHEFISSVDSGDLEGGVLPRMHRWLVSSKDVVQSNTGLLFVLAAQASFALMSVAVKMLNSIEPPITALELIAVRMIITYVFCITYLAVRNVPDPILGPKGVRLLLLFRGFSGFLGVFGVYYSLQYLSLSDATVLTFLAPMCTAMAGAFFLGENFMRREAFAGLVSLVGVVLIAKPTVIFGSYLPVPGVPVIDGQLTTDTSPVERGTQAERMIAVGISLIGVLGTAGAYTTIRAIGMRAHAVHSMAFFSLMCVIVSTVGMIATKTPVFIPTRIDWLALFIMIGVFGFVTQILLTLGLQRETAGRGSMIIYTQIVFATTLEKIFFNTVPSMLSIAGTLMIVVSAIYVALTKKKQEIDISTPKNIDTSHTSQDAGLEEGLLNPSREEHNGGL